MTDLLTARGLRGGAPDPLPELADEQAELLAFWLQERGYRMVADGEPMAPMRGLDDVSRSDRIRETALRMALDHVLEHTTGAAQGEVLASAESFRKFLMGESGDDAR